MEDKKKKITIKEYGLLDWCVYHFDNYLSFRIIIMIISFIYRDFVRIINSMAN